MSRVSAYTHWLLSSTTFERLLGFCFSSTDFLIYQLKSTGAKPEKEALDTTKSIAATVAREEMERLQVLFFLGKGVESLLTASASNPPPSYQRGISDFHRLPQQFL